MHVCCICLDKKQLIVLFLRAVAPLIRLCFTLKWLSWDKRSSPTCPPCPGLQRALCWHPGVEPVFWTGGGARLWEHHAGKDRSPEDKYKLSSWFCVSAPFVRGRAEGRPGKIERRRVAGVQITPLFTQRFHEVRLLILIPRNVYLLPTCHQMALGWGFGARPLRMSRVSPLAGDFKLNGVEATLWTLGKLLVSSKLRAIACCQCRC